MFQSWCEAKMPFNASCTSEGVNNQRKNKTSIWKVPITAWASAARTLHYTQLSFPAIKNNVSKGEMKKVENVTVERKMKQRKKKEKHLCKVLVKEAGLVMTSLSQIEAEKKSSIQNTYKKSWWFCHDFKIMMIFFHQEIMVIFYHCVSQPTRSHHDF